MTSEQHQKLNIMLHDMENQEEIYRPTTFWREASKTICEDLAQNKLENFRALKSTRSMFVPTYSMPNYLENPELFSKTFEQLKEVAPDIKSGIKLTRAFDGETQAYSDYRVLKVVNKDYPPYTNEVSESKIGNPLGQFEFNGKNYSRSFLNYSLGLEFLKQHIQNPKINIVMEIGGGFGTLGEILLGDERNNCFYINADIPPVSFVSSYYLKEVFGDKNIADYFDTKELEELNIDELSKIKKAINITSWQIPKLKGKIDLFVNFISFQEMEPEVVNNYCKYITKLEPEYILLRNILEGKKKQSKDFKYGVKEPIVGDDYDNFLSNYALVATDGEFFGFKNEDGFHSQLRLYIKDKND